MADIFDFFDEQPAPPSRPLQTLEEKIKQRRYQMLIHSYLYYQLDDPLVSDAKWQQWANELVELQKQTHDIGFYDEEFRGWDGSTGAHLPAPDHVRKHAHWLLINLRKAP